ncbi:MAG: hypothetical protein AAF603_00190 [Pseudomonadota bacterium]
MSNHSSHSRIRLVLAQFCVAHSLDIEELYEALGIKIGDANAEALAHMAGLIDGMNIAAARIKEHGLHQWTKDI